jgi:hypothetical protein
VFSLSLRDVELIMAERGTLVTQESVRRWGLKFAHPQIYAVARRHNKRGSPPDKGENSESGVSLASGENLLRCNSLCGVVVFRPWMGGYNALPRSGCGNPSAARGPQRPRSRHSLHFAGWVTASTSPQAP